jgi:hypothetical protein
MGEETPIRDEEREGEPTPEELEEEAEFELHGGKGTGGGKYSPPIQGPEPL